MSVADNSILRVVASMLWTDGNVNQNVFNALISGAGAPWDDSDVVDDCEDWLDNMYANFTPHTSDHLDGNEILVYKRDLVGADWDEVGSQAFTWNPGSGDEQLPRGTGPLIRLWTVDPDVQGKKYLMGTPETYLTNGLYAAAIVTDALAFAADWLAPFVGAATGGTITPGVWSVAQLVFKAAVDHFATSTIPAYQRRRKRTVGI